jgi:glycerol kinase
VTADHVLAIDEGGTGVRAYVFDHEGRPVGSAYQEIRISCPQPGWVEHDPTEIWERTLDVTRRALAAAGIDASRIAGLGICNQRASVIAWDGATGRPLHPAIGWQDLRTVNLCTELALKGYTVSPLQSATKWTWIIEHVPEARACSDAGRLRLGTIDAWLTDRFSGGATFVTDPSSACCTGVYDFFGHEWAGSLCDTLGIPSGALPRIVPTSAVAGESVAGLLGAAIPLAARAGDQQSAMFGQLRTAPGMTKITYGTAAMMDLNVGTSLKLSPHGAFPLILWHVGDTITYCLEATAVTAGAALQWLRDGLGIIGDVAESEALAESVPDSGGVWCVPAFQGLGTPYLDPAARATIGGLSRGSGRAHVVRAVLEGVAYRCAEILDALNADAPEPGIGLLRVDGGASRNDFLMQCQADLAGVPVERPVVLEAAALGAAYLAGLATRFWSTFDDVERTWHRERLFEPRLSFDERTARLARWRSRVALVREHG